MNNSLAFFIKNLDSEEPSIKSKLESVRDKLKADDYLIFTDFFVNNHHLYDFSIMSTFYMKFFKGSIVFFDNQDYEDYKDETLAKCTLYKD